MSKLVCTAGMNRNDEFALSEGVNTIGRSHDCTIALFDKKCSRVHCQIIKKGNYYAIEDTNSRNGTHVNGKPLVKRSPIQPGDHIHVGKSTLVLSEKAVGGALQQAATEVAAELQEQRFDKVLGAVTRDAVHHAQTHETPPKKERGMLRFLSRLLKRKS